MTDRKKVLEQFEIQKDFLESTVKANIENYRKGWGTLTVKDSEGNFIPDAKISLNQKSHEFKFGANIFMLDELETDAKNDAYKKVFAETFNMVSVDGDTSTNDMVSVLANGMAGNELIDSEGADYDAFCEALGGVTSYLCRMIAGDGEGATKLLECKVSGAKTEKDAKIVAKSVICSSLLKSAMFGADANWGRVLCAMGYSKAPFSPEDVSVKEGETAKVTVKAAFLSLAGILYAAIFKELSLSTCLKYLFLSASVNPLT